jgi:protoporphyrinogen/coproporphyrinogen III oxidase
VLIVGGGLAGLTAAAVLTAERPELSLLVVEAARRPGGQLRTTTAGGYTYEHGATALTTTRRETRELIRRAGLGPRLEPAAADQRATCIYARGALQRVPRSPRELLASRLFSTAGKLRLLAEPVAGRRTARADETVHEFAARHFGREAAGLATVALQGMTAGDARVTSIEALWPRLRALERSAGPLGLLGRAPRAQHGAGPHTFRDGGLQVLPDALAASLGSRVRCGAGVRALSRAPGGRLTAALADGTSLEAREVVLAVPAAAAASLLPALALPVPAGAPMRVVGLGYARSAFREPPSGLGFLATPGEADGVIGSIVSSNLFASQAPAGHVLVRTFVGGAFAPEAAGASGIGRVQRQLHRLFGVQGEPAFAVDTPWPSGIPQYARGHMARVAAFERRLAQHPGLRVARSALVGIGLEEAIAAGAAVARDVIKASRDGVIA